MEHKITSGQLRHYVQFMQKSTAPDEHGETGNFVQVFDARADVLVRSGGELADYGTVVTSEVITVLAWFDERAKNDMFIDWEGRKYRIDHVRPDSTRKSMIITAEIERDE